MNVLKNAMPFLLILLVLSLAGCATAKTNESPPTLLGTWPVVTMYGQHLADIEIKEIRGALVEIQVVVKLKVHHEVVDLSLALSRCVHPVSQTTAQWTRQHPSRLVWATQWLPVSPCRQKAATLLYQFASGVDGDKGRIVFNFF